MPLKLPSLPALSIQALNRLPECPAIYFALDDKNRVLYIGQAQNLALRWRGQSHHRIEQLKRIHRQHPVVLAWLDCSHCPQQLNELEATYIEEFQPLLNGTKVPARKVIPAEVVLQQSLEKIAKYIVIFGILQPSDEAQLTVVLKYLGWRREMHNLRRIFQGCNRKPTSLNWVEFIRRKNGPWWRSSCNGVTFQLGPWFEPTQPIVGVSAPVTEAICRDQNLQPLAGILLPTLTPTMLRQLFQSNSGLANNYPNLNPYQTDPVRLIWKDFSLKQ